MKRSLAVVLILMMLMGLTGCAASNSKPASTVAPETTAAAAETVKLENADGGDVITFTMLFVDPDTSPYVEGGKKIAQLVSDATGGRIQIQVQGGSELGERKLVEMAMDNELDIATCANSVLTNYIPQMNILDQAYLWKNADEAHAAVDGRLGSLIAERAETLGLHVIGFEESGFRNTFSVKPIQSMADFSGVTIRTMENKYHQAAFEAFGASPVALAYNEVIPALREGTVDACENATANCLNSGYYEITRHVTNTQHAFVYIILCMSDSAWNQIPDDLREPFMDAVQEGMNWQRNRLNEANDEATQALLGLGVQFYDIDIAQLQAAYQAKAAEKGFTFDPDWQAAVDEAIASVSVN